MNCKITNKKITPFMSFGKMPIANGFIEKKDFDNEFFLIWKLALRKIYHYFS